MAADKWSDQIRACGLFFISIVVLMVIPLVYHCFVFLTALPLWGPNPASCVTLLICFHILFILLLVSYWKVIFTDAGGVPYELDEAWISELNLAHRFGLEAEVSERVSDKDENSPLTVPSAERKLDGRQRYCRKCRKFKPDRAHHCKYCGRCVLKMDHHCPWVNNCIGYCNYKYFILFCSYATITSFYVACTIFIGFITTLIERRPIQFTVVEFEYFVVFCLMVAVTVVLTGFTGFHYMLLLKNMSTIEHVEKRDPTKKDQVNPFDLGREKNWRQVFGDDVWTWFLPIAPPSSSKSVGDGVHWETNENLQQMEDQA
ncbi:hypothetical protein GUITHDRAFT_142504 [Guillardia theta CCMP2712]|uniref:Palmitoyltransferase n=1 Tax=Guillardia theta (strain CCMP2712) TaxID=905079 RepID=L1IYC4_GUITC|nr:hypothetical protein GUITHDRAFT_142504 [Guillardia theta CCMP2712]EKX40894.1 hypothetical protein GUITHDRAFT_142504 [Guillardia theta CCMP2712]|mmetsp:Transcript_4709/g.17103  ORF Transcript_4709/g.17103 Transcript_4709/m.17103 type:complete len:316 (-) Transcript_4709:58-1005(-)|eukprot:XP_005827874.1 hypothetical protein GUITHDRAFT_142504 [Guillardia theta CCMP2712]